MIEKYNIPEDVNRVRIDIGLSYNAPISRWWLENIPNLFCIGIEPNPYSVANIKGFNILLSPYYALEPIAISTSEQIRDFYVTQIDPGCSSLYRPVDFEIKDKIMVQTQPIQYILNKLPDNQIIELIKIDTQGEDYNIIESLIPDMNRVVYIDCELSTNGQYELIEKNIFNLMVANNFVLLGVVNGNGRFYNSMFKTEIEEGKYNNNTIPNFD